MLKKLILVALLSTAAASQAHAQALPPPVAQPGDGPEDAKLKTLFYESDEASLKRNPISGIFSAAICVMPTISATT